MRLGHYHDRAGELVVQGLITRIVKRIQVVDERDESHDIDRRWARREFDGAVDGDDAPALERLEKGDGLSVPRVANTRRRDAITDGLTSNAAQEFDHVDTLEHQPH